MSPENRPWSDFANTHDESYDDDPTVDEWRRDLVQKYGEEIVTSIEKDAADSVPWPCRDTMDGRRWCRIHDASWPSFTGTGCTGWLSSGGSVDEEEPTHE